MHSRWLTLITPMAQSSARGLRAPARDCRRVSATTSRPAHGQHAIAFDTGRETGETQTPRDFLRHVPASGEAIGGPGVMEQAATGLQHAGELVVKRL